MNSTTLTNYLLWAILVTLTIINWRLFDNLPKDLLGKTHLAPITKLN